MRDIIRRGPTYDHRERQQKPLQGCLAPRTPAAHPGLLMGFKALLDQARPYALSLGLIVLLSLLSSLAFLALPALAARLLGGIFTAQEIDLAWVVVLLLFALLALAILRVLSALVAASVGTTIEARLRRDIYSHVQRRPMGFFDQNRQGDLLALLTWEVSSLSAFISGTLTSVPSALIVGAGAVTILFTIDPRLAWLIPILLPAYYFSLKLIGRRLRVLATQIQQAEAGVFATAEEDLEMLPAIKAFAREDVRLREYRKVVNKARRLKVEDHKIYAVLGPSLELITALGAVLLLLLANQSFTDQRIDGTELFSFLLYAALLTRPVGSLANLYGQFNSARGTLKRLQYVLQEAPEAGYAKPDQPAHGKGWIAFENVWFSYREREDTLKGADFDIKPGEIVALVGDNGAGKSTIVRLLLGFYTPRNGRITLDGLDVATLDVRQLRRKIGYVPQRPLLQNGTIIDNLTLGEQGFAKSDIEKACTLAQAHDFINNLPDGYQTEIGDHGLKLSGGQQQRIALARALLEDPPILVLDEATSMYDLGAEAAFVEACQTALLGRTVIIITHRPASLALADRTLKVENGAIAEILVAPSDLARTVDLKSRTIIDQSPKAPRRSGFN